MKSTLAGLLSTLMITVTIGVPVFRHTCYVSDKSEVTVLIKEHCCDADTNNHENNVDLKCCSMQQYDTSFDYETLVKKFYQVSFSFALTESVESTVTTYFTRISERLPVLRPPPLANRDLHTRIQLYLI
jgi:hypothetical protein